MNETDRKILTAHAPQTRARCAIELHIVRLLITTLRAAGYALTFDDGGDRIQTPDDDKAVEHLFGVDEAYIITRKEGCKTSSVWLVFGNDGWDVICDYGVSLEPVIGTLGEEIDAISDGKKVIGFQL